MKTIEKIIKRAGYAHAKQYKKLLQIEDGCPTTEARIKHSHAFETWQDAGRAIVEAEKSLENLERKLAAADHALHDFLREL